MVQASLTALGLGLWQLPSRLSPAHLLRPSRWTQSPQSPEHYHGWGEDQGALGLMEEHDEKIFNSGGLTLGPLTFLPLS